MKIIIIDYGLGNLRSIEKALQHVVQRYSCGTKADVKISNDPSIIDRADALILPGVGAFRDAMINFSEFSKLVIDATNEGKSLLGICLGMQMLCSESEEGGYHKGINIIPGKVIRFPKSELKVPHMGWNSIIIKKNIPLLNDVENGSFFYFVHSYHANIEENYEVAMCDYGIEFPAIICNEGGNVFGTQFHPEKSGTVGLKILSNFVKNYI